MTSLIFFAKIMFAFTMTINYSFLIFILNQTSYKNSCFIKSYHKKQCRQCFFIIHQDISSSIKTEENY